MHCDESGLRVGATTSWLQRGEHGGPDVYAAYRKRGCEALIAVGVFTGFPGRAVTDGLPSYWQYGHRQQLVSNAHRVRELTFLEEQLGQGWARKLKESLFEI